MFQVKRIVVGVEMPKQRPWTADALAAPSRLAVRHATEIASNGRTPITLVSVLNAKSAGWLSSHDDADRQLIMDRTAADAVLRDLQAKYATESNLAIECAVRVGDAWEELIRIAGNRPDTLTVVGTRDLSSLRRVLFGSTGLKLLRLSPGPVWIYKPSPVENESTDIVAATDLGPVGANVIRTAVSIAAGMSARVHIIHAASPGSNESELQGQVYEQLAETDYRTLPFGVKVTVSHGEADQCILNAVSDVNADLVVLGTSSQTGVSGLLPGSTVERLLPELQCSVLALKPDGFRSVLPPDFWTMQRIQTQG